MDNKIYYVCKYTPLELVQSFDLEIERLDPRPSAFECADSTAHPNLCSYGRAVLEEILSGKIEKILLVDCCDVIRRIYDILSMKKELPFLFLMYLPHKNGEAEKLRMKNELLRLNKYLENYTSKTFNEEKARSLWKEGIREYKENRVEDAHILLTGAHGGVDLKNNIETITGLPVRDETCTANRLLREEKGGIFFEDYAEALLSQKSPCMRMQFEGEESTESVAKICHTIKFCDYYGFQYRHLKEKNNNILKIETDYSSQSEGQIKTRLEAFAEILKPRKEVKILEKEYVAGIDSGSSSTNAVILNKNKEIIGYSIIPTGGGAIKSGKKALDLALKMAGLEEGDISEIITTGYGRNNLESSDSQITEISCHAKAAFFLNPDTRTVIDIGGQDSKVIVMDEEGNIINFVMNDKCAAGTGRFLEMMAKTLDLSLEEMSKKGLEWKNSVTISSTCTVFAESEVVSLISNNTPVPDIINGLNRSIASGTFSLIRRAKGRPAYTMTGGVSNNKGVVKALEEKLSEKIFIPEEAQICGALGAALFALT